MTEQQNPQFIFWVKEAGVFRPATPKMPDNFIGHSLEKNVELGTEDISSSSLNLVGSVYLGPINMYEESLGNMFTNDAFERYRRHNHGTAVGIIRLAEDLAKEQGVPYFSVNVVQTRKDRTWKFEAREKLFELLRKDKPYRSLINDEPPEPTEFVLHPTAQLYVMK